MNSEYKFAYPYTAPLGLLMAWLDKSTADAGQLLQGIGSLTAVFLAALIFTFVYLRRADMNV